MKKVIFFLIALFCAFNSNAQSYTIEQELFQYIFTAPLGNHLLYPSITTKNQLANQLKTIDLSPNDFFTKTNQIVVNNHQTIDSIYKVDFSLNSKSYNAYNYFIQGNNTQDSIAFFIIPGSGNNESIQIYNGNSANYQGDISNKTKPYGDTYIFVKPNEDFLAWHNQTGKLTWEAYVNIILNQGHSYTSHYFVQAIACIKDLQKRYKKVVVLGCSQGGFAAMFVSLKTNPFATVVSSGYSILFEDIDWSGQNQAVIPGIFEYYDSSSIKQSLGAQSTKYLFTYGLNETDFYKIESHNHTTENYFNGLTNVQFAYDSNAHTYPEPRVANFLTTVLTPKPFLNIKNDTTIILPDSLLLKTDLEPGLTYQWYKNDTMIANANNHQYFAKSSGYYKVKATRQSGLFGYSPAYLCNFRLFLNSNTTFDRSTIKAFIDLNKLFIELDNQYLGEIHIRVIGMDGREISDFNTHKANSKHNLQLLLPPIESGIYLIEVFGKNYSERLKLNYLAH